MARKRSGAAGEIALVALGVLAAPAAAATLCVNPTGSRGCLRTIAEAVATAPAGSVIQVQPGAYFENVTIATDGLHLVGAGRLATILDPDAPNSGPALRIEARGVEVRNLTIRNGRADAIQILGDGALIQGVRIVGVRGGSGIVAFGGSGHRVLLNEVRAVDGAGIALVDANDALVKGNVVVQAPEIAILVRGENAEVVSNRVVSSDDGIRVEGGSATVSANVVENMAATGLTVFGSSPVVQGNRLVASGSLEVQCTGTCAEASVTGNSILGSLRPFSGTADTPALIVFSGDAGLIAKANKVSQSRTGFLFAGTGIQAALNTTADTLPGSACFLVTGSGHSLSRNAASRCGGAGFRIGDAADARLDLNVAAGAHTSGFLVQGAAGRLTRNRALSANGQGFAVLSGAFDTVLGGNSDSKSRVGFCDQGLRTDTSGGNLFKSTATTCDILN